MRSIDYLTEDDTACSAVAIDARITLLEHQLDESIRIGNRHTRDFDRALYKLRNLIYFSVILLGLTVEPKGYVVEIAQNVKMQIVQSLNLPRCNP
jgi:hypothetical protein